MKTEKANATATVKDFSNGQDGTKEIEVPYNFEYDVLESAAEVAEKFAPEELRNLCNARIKSTANSGARQQAIAPYAQDPNSVAAIRERMVKDAMKLNKTREQAETFVDSLLSA